MRKLKFHEKKLLKKVDFLEWKREGGQRENLVMHRYHVTGRDDYKKYFFEIIYQIHVFGSVRDFVRQKNVVLSRTAVFVIRYSGLCRSVQKLVSILKQMDPRDPYRIEMTDNLLEKL